jgi:hypothetical protein
MTTRQKQSRFMLMVGKLIVWAYSRGYELTGGDLWSSPDYRTKNGAPPHKANSLHYERLAIDLNLFKDGGYLAKTEDHRELGEYWESLGGSWGGRFNDGNHYSLAHEGRK